MLDHTITCPECMSTLKIVDGIAYIPTDKAPLEQLKPFEQQPPEFKGDEYYEQQTILEGLDPLYSAAVDYIKTCNAITLPMLQRYFNIPPERAEQLMQQLEDNKVVAPFDGIHPRKILIPHNTGLPGMFSHTQQYDPEAAQQQASSSTGEERQLPRSHNCTCSLPGCGIILFILLLSYILAQLLR